MSVEQGSVKDQVRQYIHETARNRGLQEVSDNESLTKAGIIDSLGIFRLISFLEETFHIRVGDDEIVNENFQSIDEIERFVNAKFKAEGKA